MPFSPNVQAAVSRIASEVKGLRLDRPGGYQSPGVRRAQFAFGCGGESDATDRDNAFQRIPIKLPVKTARWRLRVSNRTPSGTSGTGTWAITSTWIGQAFKHLDTGDLIPWIGGHSQALGSSGTIAASGEWVSPWVSAANQQILPGEVYYISMAWTKAAGSRLYFGSGGSFSSTTVADVGVASPNMTYIPYVAFNVAVEYEFVGNNKIGVVVGDSITEGAKQIWNINAYHQRLSMRTGMPICMSAQFGSFAGEGFTNNWGFESLTAPRWQRLRDADCNIDFGIVHLGTNETAWGGNLLGVQRGLVATQRRMQSEWGVRDVYGTTLAPRSAALGSASENLRVAVNNWLRSGWPFFTDVFDISNVLEASPGSEHLQGRYQGGNGGGDATHWGPAGHLRAADAFVGLGAV